MTDHTRRRFLANSAGLVAAATFPRRLGSPLQASQFDLVVVGGRVIDPAQDITARRDVGVSAGRIAQVAEQIAPNQGRQVLDASGKIVTPGLIDIHTHVYDGVARFGIEPDPVGIAKGVTSLIDAGSAGATTFPGFRAYVAQPARTRVYALLNISSPGMTVRNEIALLDDLDVDAAVQTIQTNRDVIVGIKVRMLAGVPDGHDVQVMRRTRAAADRAGVPIMVHIGGQTLPLPRILDLLKPGDVVTHALRRRGSILDGNGRIYPEVREAVANGIHLDIGHGRGNLDFDVAERVLDQGLLPTTISSDVHRGNVLGPVFGLPTTLSKFMLLGMSLEQVIERATASPARIFELGEELGTLREGTAADLAVFELAEGDYEFMDSGGKRRRATQRLVPYASIRDGRPYGSINI